MIISIIRKTIFTLMYLLGTLLNIAHVVIFAIITLPFGRTIMLTTITKNTSICTILFSLQNLYISGSLICSYWR